MNELDILEGLLKDAGIRFDRKPLFPGTAMGEQITVYEQTDDGPVNSWDAVGGDISFTDGLLEAHGSIVSDKKAGEKYTADELFTIASQKQTAIKQNITSRDEEEEIML